LPHARARALTPQPQSAPRKITVTYGRLASGQSVYAYANGNPFKNADPAGTNALIDLLTQYAIGTLQATVTNMGNSALLQKGLCLSKNVANFGASLFYDLATGNEAAAFKDTFQFSYPITPLWNGDEQGYLFDQANQRLQTISNTQTINTFLGNESGASSSSFQTLQPINVPASTFSNGFTYTPLTFSNGPVPQ